MLGNNPNHGDWGKSSQKSCRRLVAGVSYDTGCDHQGVFCSFASLHQTPVEIGIHKGGIKKKLITHEGVLSAVLELLERSVILVRSDLYRILQAFEQAKRVGPMGCAGFQDFGLGLDSNINRPDPPQAAPQATGQNYTPWKCRDGNI
ncbi:hypothetical protein TEA_024231 [Camellia sinensis var. sinensis]|uniref:Uncharacterized protein n=1 Tax=Camellia sinensis var. sinensis TaxID=542762 RepID=A0A4S4DWC6_CAMSN|nr:hypothetical protein TEA_024231 [Camellia sinensis var. sinensis]